MNDETLLRVLRLTAGPHEALPIWWRLGDGSGDADESALTFFVECSDVFFWGSSDVEPITNDSIETLTVAVLDAQRAMGPDAGSEGFLLYCARQRGTRPQGAMYPLLHSATWPLCDQAGPAREVGFGNPHAHPSARPETSGRETRPALTEPRYDIRMPTTSTRGVALADQPASVETIRVAFETTAFEYTDCLRWTIDNSVPTGIRLFAITCDQDRFGGEGSTATAEITDANIGDLVDRFAAAEAVAGRYRADLYDVAADFIAAQPSTTIPDERAAR